MIGEVCKDKLLKYADTFEELARSYEEEFKVSDGSRQEILEERRFWENRQVLRIHLKEMARIMEDVAEEMTCFEPMGERKKKLLTQAMRREGIFVENPCYFFDEDGKRAMILSMSTSKRAGIGAEEVADMISVLLDRHLKPSVTSPYVVDKQRKVFVLEEEPRFLALTGFSKVAKQDERVSGDNVSVVERQNGSLVVMLSDGTGSGEQAGSDSARVLELMERMLDAGYRPQTAIEMANTSLFAERSEQNHPTLDVCKVDLCRGECEIRKVGAAASFLKRGAQVEVLSAPSLPLGIFQKPEAKPICVEVEDGDYLILLTDGITEVFGEEDYETLQDYLSGITEQNPSEIAKKILRAALYLSEGKVADDMTVGVIGIWEQNPCSDR
jgi:stage II sporulation protein E